MPVLTLPRRALPRFVGDGLFGLCLTRLDDLGGQLVAVDVDETRCSIASVRLQLTVEPNVHHLVELYEAVSDA